MSNIIIIGILALVLVYALRGTIKHFKGQGACCGGECMTMPEPPKKLEGQILGTKLVTIEGMHCENCKNTIERAVNRVEGLACQVNLKKKQAQIRFNREVSDEEIKAVIERMEFQVVSIQ